MSNNQTPIPDLTALDREALARIISDLQAQIDCGVPPRDGCLNPGNVCLTCRLADANRVARKQARDAGELEVQLAAARAEVDRLTAADNSDFDATDAASPAWWRGHDHTTKVFCALVNDILDAQAVDWPVC
jgi:hypothetical protein